MLTFLIPVIASLQTPTPAPTAGAVVTKMFERYAYAKTVGGTIRTVQVAGGVSLVTDTNLAFERPSSKLRLEQRRKTSDGMTERYLVSDGNVFRYTPPERIISATPFLTEAVQPPERPKQSIADLYLILAADLPDRSPALDAAIARPEDLNYFKNQLATFSLAGREKVGEREANLVVGDWRESDTTRVSGKYRMDITDAGDLLRYVLILTVAAPTGVARPGQAPTSGEPFTVTTTWTVDLAVDATLKPETFVFRP